MSQYLTAIQDAGDNPPQETGLTYNTWEGKFHLEMHWWHEAHFALWNRLPLLENSLGYYQKILPRAEGTAQKQGYAGARWPKMTSPSGAESPSPVGPFLVWQEPHPIFYAELCWREHHDRATLEKYRDIVFQTADFMASYATWDTNTSRYVLGPVLQCAQEIFPKDKTLNPTFELTYWRWGLETAQQWRQRLGLPREKKWDDVLNGPRQAAGGRRQISFHRDDAGLLHEPEMERGSSGRARRVEFCARPGRGRGDDAAHAGLDLDQLELAGHLGLGLSDAGDDRRAAGRTGARRLTRCCSTRRKIITALNGHVYQRPGLTIYLPANGGLLYATALMAAGWDGAPKKDAPGFPDNGQWSVRWENLHPGALARNGDCLRERVFRKFPATNSRSNLDFP